MSKQLLIGGVIDEAVASRPQALAATLGEDELSFAELDARADRLGGALLRLGVGPGSVVAWFAGPSLRNLTAVLACARIGAILAPIPPESQAETAAAAVQEMQAQLLVCDQDRLQLARTLGVELLAYFGGSETVLGVDVLERLEAESEPLQGRAPALSEDDPHILYLTSGSTGRPKGVLVSHRASWLRSAPDYDPGQPRFDGILCSFPMHHYGGMHYVLEAWLRSTAVHLVRRASGREVVAAVELRKPQAIYCIPAVWRRVFETSGDLSSIRFADTGTSQVAVELLQGISQRLPQARTRILYGATEAGRMAALEPAELELHRGSVGRPPGEGRVRIAEDGEVLFSGPTVMNGYHRRREETESVLQDGWYRTGDVGRLDADGYLYLTGRKGDLIRTGGEWVSPAKVDALLHQLPGLRDAGVVGLAHQDWGQIVCAAVVPADGHGTPAVQELQQQLASLAPHERPRLVVAVPEVPRTAATGQVMRARLLSIVETLVDRTEGVRG